MRIISYVFILWCTVTKSNALISPSTTINTSIYHYNPLYDIYRYGSKDRKFYKKKYYHLVQDHHIIPKELKNHSLRQITIILYLLFYQSALFPPTKEKNMKKIYITFS